MDALYFSRNAVAIGRNALGEDHFESIQLSADKEIIATEIGEAGKLGDQQIEIKKRLVQYKVKNKGN